MLAATRAPTQIAALGLWEPPTAWVDWWPTPELRASATAYAAHPDPLALGEEFNRWMLGDERWESLAEPTKDMLRKEGRAFRTDMASEVVEPFRFEDLTMPIVVGCGTETSSGHLEGGRRLAALLGAELYEVEGANHFVPVSDPPVWATMARRAYALAH
jgi:pimeloyl-ACP methyl ester carboxylesterase